MTNYGSFRRISLDISRRDATTRLPWIVPFAVLIGCQLAGSPHLRAQNLLKKKGGGRVAAIEVLVVNAAVASLIREGKTSQIMSIMQTAKKEGMTLLNEQLALLVKSDTVEPDEAYRKAVDKDDLIKQFESMGINFTRPAD